MDVFHINCSNSTKSRKASECIVSSNLYLTKDKVFGQNRMGFWLQGYYKTFLMSEKLDPIFSKSICNPLKNTNSFHATALFLHPLKTLENLWFSAMFRGWREIPVAWNGLKYVTKTFLEHITYLKTSQSGAVKKLYCIRARREQNKCSYIKNNSCERKWWQRYQGKCFTNTWLKN